MQETTAMPETTGETTETTARLNLDDLREGWAELGRTPRVLASVKMGAKTDLGRVRENNEDKFDFYEPEDLAVLATKGTFYAVADGMGGHSAGQIACELALKTVIREYYASPTADIEASLRQAISDANALVYDTGQMIAERQNMGTTLTAAIVREDRLTLAQVGDSRAYLVRDGSATQLTEDHSWVAEQVRQGVMTVQEAQGSPFRNIITRSIGTASTVESDITSHALQPGDRLVLCSDGLTAHLEPEEIAAVVQEHSPSVAALRLVDAANERGGRDNITVLVLSVRALVPAGEDGADGVQTDALAPQSVPASPPAESEQAGKRHWLRRK